MGALDHWYQLPSLRQNILTSLGQVVFQGYPEAIAVIKAALGNEGLWLEQQEEASLVDLLLKRLEEQFDKWIDQIEGAAESEAHAQTIVEQQVREHAGQLEPVIVSFRSFIDPEQDKLGQLLNKLEEFQLKMGLNPKVSESVGDPQTMETDQTFQEGPAVHKEDFESAGTVELVDLNLGYNSDGRGAATGERIPDDREATDNAEPALDLETASVAQDAPEKFDSAGESELEMEPPVETHGESQDDVEIIHTGEGVFVGDLSEIDEAPDLEDMEMELELPEEKSSQKERVEPELDADMDKGHAQGKAVSGPVDSEALESEELDLGLDIEDVQEEEDDDLPEGDVLTEGDDLPEGNVLPAENGTQDTTKASDLIPPPDAEDPAIDMLLDTKKMAADRAAGAKGETGSVMEKDGPPYLEEEVAINGRGTDAEDTPEAYVRMTHVHYFKKMRPMATFPLTVSMKLPETSPIPPDVNPARQKKGETFQVADKSSLVTIVPVFPGCVCVPERIEVDLSVADVDAEFFLTPLCTGRLKQARIDIRREGKTLNRMDIKAKVVTQRMARLMAVLMVLMPILSHLANSFRIDLSALVQKEFPILGTMSVFIGNYGLLIGGVCLLLAILFYFSKRPTKGEPVKTVLDLESVKAPPAA